MSEENADSIMAPDEQVSIKGGNSLVLVKEMNWKAHRLFLTSLAPHAGAFLSLDGSGAAQIDQGKLIGVLLTAVGEELIVEATGKPREWVDELSGVDFFALLNKAVALNLRPELLDHVKNLVGQFRGLTTKLDLADAYDLLIGVGRYSGEYLDTRTWRQINLMMNRLVRSLEDGPRGDFLRRGISL